MVKFVYETEHGSGKYREVIAWIYAAIEEGEHPPGNKLPTISELAEKYGTTKSVVRRAIDILKGHGLLRSDPGIGVWVVDQPDRLVYIRADPRIDPPEGLSTLEPWEVACEEQGRDGSPGDVVIGRDRANTDLARRLEVEPGTELVRRSRRMRLDGTVAEIQDSWMPAVLADGTAFADAATWDGGTYAAMWIARLMPAYASEEVTARLPTTDEVRRLEIRYGLPVLVAWRTVWDLRGRPIEARRVIAVGQRVAFTYDGLRVERPPHLWSGARIAATLSGLFPWTSRR